VVKDSGGSDGQYAAREPRGQLRDDLILGRRRQRQRQRQRVAEFRRKISSSRSKNARRVYLTNLNAKERLWSRAWGETAALQVEARLQ